MFIQEYKEKGQLPLVSSSKLYDKPIYLWLRRKCCPDMGQSVFFSFYWHVKHTYEYTCVDKKVKAAGEKEEIINYTYV